MTREHYEMIAETIYEAFLGVPHDQREPWRRYARELADRFLEDNTWFDRARFLRVAIGRDE